MFVSSCTPINFETVPFGQNREIWSIHESTPRFTSSNPNSSVDNCWGRWKCDYGYWIWFCLACHGDLQGYQQEKYNNSVQVD